MKRPLRLWSASTPWLMLPHNLGHLPAKDGIRVTPRKILGGKRWQIALLTDMETADESGLARRKQASRSEDLPAGPTCGEAAGHFEISVADGKRYDPPLLALAFCGLPEGHEGEFHLPSAAPSLIDDEGF